MPTKKSATEPTDEIKRIRFRIIALVFVMLIPSLFFSFYAFVERRDRRIAEYGQVAAQLIRTISIEQENYLHGATAILRAFADDEDVTLMTVSECDRLAKKLAFSAAYIVDIGAINSKGDIYCSADPHFSPDKVILDKPIAEDAGGAATVSSAFFDETAKKPLFVIRLPFTGASNNDSGIVYATIDLSIIAQTFPRINLSDGSSLSLITKNGLILLRYPENGSYAGKIFSDSSLMGAVLNNKNSAPFEASGLDGIKRIYAAERSPIGFPDEVYAVLGIPKSYVLNPAYSSLIKQDVFLALISLFALFFAWRFSGRVILQRYSEILKLNQMKSDFVSMASHQLKTPAALIVSYAENLLNGVVGQLNERQFKYATDMKKISDENIALINDLLDLSQLDRGVVRLDLVDIPAERIVNEAVRSLEQYMKQKRISLVKKNNAGEATVRADKIKAIEVLRNVLHNAIKFSNNDSTIVLEIAKSGEDILVSITDYGDGISPQAASRLFVREKLLSDITASSGAGLGLYLAKHFMVLMGGDITYTSEQGNGTTFVVHFTRL